MARPYAAASATALALLLAGTSLAQTYRDTGGSVVPGVVPLGGDGSGPLFTSSNPAKVSGTFSATLSGFQPTPAYSYQSVTTSSAAYTLPSGTTVVVYDTGSNPITIKLGASGVGVTSGQADVVPAGGWMAFTVGSATYYAVVGNGGPSTVVVSGGSGLPTGSGGGGGGGAGGMVAQGAPALAAGAWPVSETVAGSVVSSSNPVPISFGGGVTLPAFASTPTVNIGAAPTLTISGSLGRSWTLSSTGDSVAIGGTLPAFASTPAVTISGTPSVSISGTPSVSGTVTANLGTLNGAATAANQSTMISALGSGVMQNSGGSVSLAGNLPAFSTPPAVAQSGTWSTGRTWNLSSGADSVTATISGTVPVSLTSLPALSNGSNTIGGVTITPSTSGGISSKGTVTVTGLQLIGSAGAHQIYRLQCDNLAGSANVWVEVFDAASTSAVTLGTTTPSDHVAIAAAGTGGFTLSGLGVQYSSGIVVAAVTAYNGTTAATTSVPCDLDYK